MSKGNEEVCFGKWVSCRIDTASLPELHEGLGAHAGGIGLPRPPSPGPFLGPSCPARPVESLLKLSGPCLERMEGFDLQEVSLKGKRFLFWGCG